MTKTEQQIINELQQDLPVVSRPYAAVATRLSMPEDRFLGEVRSMLERGVIRKVGAVLRHRRVGIRANALCVWQVPADRITAVGELFATLPAVTHCYERQTYAGWPYNLYTMVHAGTEKECQEHITAMQRMSDVGLFRILYSTCELKKTSMRYFE